MEEVRCASHHGPGRSCGWKIGFSQPPRLSLAEDLAMAGVRRYRDDGEGLGNGEVRRHRGNGAGLSRGVCIQETPE